MKISLIVAMSSNNAIGINGKMPWHLPADLKRFKQITMGSPILMGRKTYEAIGKPLKGRVNIILSSDKNYQQADCVCFYDLDSALAFCQNNPEIFVIGGASLYQLFLPKADFLYLTEINQHFIGDTFFPAINLENWLEIQREDVLDDNTVDFTYRFLKLERQKA